MNLKIYLPLEIERSLANKIIFNKKVCGGGFLIVRFYTLYQIKYNKYCKYLS